MLAFELKQKIDEVKKKYEDILQVLQEGRGRRPAVYGYADLLNVAEGYRAFK